MGYKKFLLWDFTTISEEKSRHFQIKPQMSYTRLRLDCIYQDQLHLESRNSDFLGLPLVFLD